MEMYFGVMSIIGSLFLFVFAIEFVVLFSACIDVLFELKEYLRNRKGGF